mgnify:CR=1 FL=1
MTYSVIVHKCDGQITTFTPQRTDKQSDFEYLTYIHKQVAAIINLVVSIDLLCDGKVVKTYRSGITEIIT